jgi:selenocysteine-specific elongation factor
VIPVSATTGQGLDELRKALSTLISQLPPAHESAPVRLWLDRSFTIRGSGTVVTGTLGAGTLQDGDELTLDGTTGRRQVRVRGLQTLGNPAHRVPALARVAVNLRGVDKRDVARGDALLAPGAWHRTAEVDGQIEAGDQSLEVLPAELILHIGSAAVAARLRPLGAAGPHRTARLRLHRALPLAAGDVGLLRDPGAHLIVGRFRVLDVDPPALARRGAASARAAELNELATSATSADGPDGSSLLHRHGVMRESALIATGSAVPDQALRANGWLVDDAIARRWSQELAVLVAEHRRSAPLEPGPTLEQARIALGTPDTEVIAALAQRPLSVRDGRLIDVTAPPPVPAAIAAAVGAVVKDLAERPFSAPDAARLEQLGLGPKELAAAEGAGALLRIAPGVVLLPDADTRAATLLARIPQPFSLSEARQHLGTTRRVAVPLLELLDARRLTQRLPDDRRVVMRDVGD